MPNRPMSRREIQEKKQARVDKYYNVGRVLGTIGGAVPFVAGDPANNALNVSPLAVAGGYLGNRLGGEVGTDLANLVNRIQFGKHI